MARVRYNLKRKNRAHDVSGSGRRLHEIINLTPSNSSMGSENAFRGSTVSGEHVRAGSVGGDGVGDMRVLVVSVAAVQSRSVCFVGGERD